MAKQPIRTDAAPPPGGAYSQAIAVGNLVFTAGMTPMDPATGRMAGEDVATQTTQVLKNLAAVLEAAGSGLDRTVKATVHLADLARDFDAMNAVYARLMPDPKPVRTTVGSQLHGFLVEIDLVAERA